MTMALYVLGQCLMFQQEYEDRGSVLVIGGEICRYVTKVDNGTEAEYGMEAEYGTEAEFVVLPMSLFPNVSTYKGLSSSRSILASPLCLLVTLILVLHNLFTN